MWKWPYLLNWVDYFDKLLRKHWYWQDLAQEIAKWHFNWSRLYRTPNSERVIMALSFELSGILRLNFAYTLTLTRCTPWDCQMTFEINWVFCRVSNSENNETIAKWHLSSIEALPSAKFWKSEIGLISWTEWNILIDFCVNIDIDNILPKRLWNVIFHRSRFCRAPNSEKVKMAVSLELSGTLWWNFADTLVWTRCSLRDCQMIFGIGRGFAEVQILKKKKKLNC